VLDKTCAALHETPHQLEIIRPLTRFATRITAPEMIPAAIAAAADAGGPAFIEIPHDLLQAPLPPGTAPAGSAKPPLNAAEAEIKQALAMIQKARKPAIVVGSSVASHDAVAPVLQLAEALQAPVLTTTSGKGVIPDDHPLAMGCLSRLGAVVDVMKESDLLIGIGARLTEFDSSRFSLKLPPDYLQIDDDPAARSDFFVPGLRIIGDIAATARAIMDSTGRRQPWWDSASARKQ
jgi:acetolactate synthase-1/2/3 large subunit